MRKISGSEEALGLRLRLQGVGTVTWRMVGYDTGYGGSIVVPCGSGFTSFLWIESDDIWSNYGQVVKDEEIDRKPMIHGNMEI